ncbi:ABC transporter permease [Mangrovactinospora gilvigrisea]|uniref:ABC transporter permease n=1 Tax=Mangrovactinospora gilvigrisea TaxID=1428644 RepID=A0A1J7C993_9ACTN|nr:EamA family transporter [Mangrovactinospora gilvigrisea]OIV38104.1 ABC transporter permease [Mangrovactinospora gilvigrisea]
MNRTVLPTALAPAAWGTTYLVTSQWLPPDRPLLSGVLRALPAGLIALALARRLPQGVWWWRSLVLGTLNIGAFFVLLFVAAYRLPGGLAATLGAAQPLLAALFAMPVLGDRPTRRRLGWAVAGVAGVALVVLRAQASPDPLGIAAGLAGTASMALGTVLAKRWGRPAGVGALAVTGWQLTAGGLLIVPLALAVEGPPPALDTPAVLGYAWLAIVGTLAAYLLWFRGIARLPVAAVSFLPLLSPLVAAIVGWAALGQGLTPVQVLGFALALTSVAAAQFTPARPEPALAKGI